jgi:hypothetical protein
MWRRAPMTIRLNGDRASLVVGSRELHPNERITLAAGELANVISYHMLQIARRSLQARPPSPEPDGQDTDGASNP